MSSYLLPSNLISPTFSPRASNQSSPLSRRGVFSPDTVGVADGFSLNYKRTFIDVSPPLSASMQRSNSMPSLRLDESDDDADDVIYIEDFDLDCQPGSDKRSPIVVAPTVSSHVQHDISAPKPLLLADSFIFSKTSEDSSVVTPPVLAYTTVMLRNIPNKFSQMEIVNTLNQKGFQGLFDFFYAPLDFKSKCNLGRFIVFQKIACKFYRIRFLEFGISRDS